MLVPAQAPHSALRLPGWPQLAISPEDWAALMHTPEGVTLMFRDLDAYLEALGEEAHVSLDALPYPALCHLARYVPHLLETETPLRRAVAELISAQISGLVPLAVEFGCSVGPDLRTLREHAEYVIGLDRYLTPLRLAATGLAGQPICHPVRLEGRSFTMAAPIVQEPLDGVSLICANALDPPLGSAVADLVVAINLFDNVPEPINLIGQMDAVLRPGGLMLIASPFHWQDSFTPPNEQFGGGTIENLVNLGSPEALRELLAGKTPWLQHLCYAVLETRDVPWVLRDHARCEVRYDVHLLMARKLA